MTPDLSTIYDVIEATWPAAATTTCGPFTLRDGAGGGKRVSSATAEAPVSAADLMAAEQAMQQMGQAPLVQIRAGETELDHLLDAQGYRVVDPVNIYVSPVEPLASEDVPGLAAFSIWEPLAIMRDIWAQGGIGPERVAVMERANFPKTALFGRHDSRPAATGYVGLHAGVAMVHALEVLPRHQRQGLGRILMIRAAQWAREEGASHLSVICTAQNTAANGLYASLGMTLVGHYHYRLKDTA